MMSKCETLSSRIFRFYGLALFCTLSALAYFFFIWKPFPAFKSSHTSHGSPQTQNFTRSLDKFEVHSELLCDFVVDNDLGFKSPCDSKAPSKTSEFHSVSVVGDGFYFANTHTCSCFFIQAFTKKGFPYDRKCRQRSFFVPSIQSSTGITLTPLVTYLHALSLHKVCYSIPEPGEYNLTVRMEWSNYDVLTRFAPLGLDTVNGLAKRADVIGGGVKGFMKNLPVATSSLKVSRTQLPGNFSRAQLPRCTLQILADSENQGFWKGSVWYPTACQLARISPEGISKCLEGKNVLFVGDSQMRYTFAEFLAYLGDKTREKHFQIMNSSEFFAVINQKQGFSTGSPHMNPRTNTVWRNQTKFGDSVDVTLFGTFWTGFAKATVRTQKSGAETPNQRAKKGGGGFNVTYISHLVARNPLYLRWMTSPEIVGEDNLVYDGAPFDHVMAASGIHDQGHMYSHHEFGVGLRRSMVPSLLEVVRSPKDITWTSTWAAHLLQKKSQFIPKCSNPRGEMFNAMARKVVGEFNVTNWLDLWHMTVARPDLCLDSTHFSWPVTLSMIEMWLGFICGE